MPQKTLSKSRFSIKSFMLLWAMIISFGFIGSQLITSFAAQGNELTNEDIAFVSDINAHRASVGAAALSASGCLTAAAQEWSRAMADSNTLAHGDFAGRITAHCGGGGSWEGENALEWPGTITASQALSIWLSDAPHKANVEATFYNYIGVSLFYDSVHNVTWGVTDFEGCSAGCASFQTAPSYPSPPPPSPSPSPPSSSPSKSASSGHTTSRPAPLPPPPAPPPPPPPPSAPTIITATIDGTKQDLSKPFTTGYSRAIIIGGTTVANGVVTLTIHSDPQTATVTADPSGNWSYAIKNLAPGTHEIDATVTDPNTKLASSSTKLLSFKIGAKPKLAKTITTPNKSLLPRASLAFILLFALGTVSYYGASWSLAQRRVKISIKSKSLGNNNINGLTLKYNSQLLIKVLPIIVITLASLIGAFLIIKSFESPATDTISLDQSNSFSLNKIANEPLVARIILTGTAITLIIIGVLYAASLLNIKSASHILNRPLKL